MVTVTNIAQRMLDENNYSVSAFGSKTNIEYLVDNAIDYINMMAGTSIADLAGPAETKSLIGTENEIVTVKFLAILLLRAYKDRGPNMAVGGISASTVLADSQYDFYSKQLNRMVNRLCGRSFDRVT